MKITRPPTRRGEDWTGGRNYPSNHPSIFFLGLNSSFDSFLITDDDEAHTEPEENRFSGVVHVGFLCGHVSVGKGGWFAPSG